MVQAHRQDGPGQSPAVSRSLFRQVCRPYRQLGRKGGLVGRSPWQSSHAPPSPCVLLVMESPHIDEHSPKLFYTPWPANGPTGKRIRQRIAAADLPITADTGLVLMNAIPFQCSLGISPIGKDRDTVFRPAWERGGRGFFPSRLMHWYRTEIWWSTHVRWAKMANGHCATK